MTEFKKAKEEAARASLAKAALELAKISNERPQTKEQAEDLTRRAT